MRRTVLVIIMVVIIILLFSASAYLLIDGYRLKKDLAVKDKELDSKISQERDIIKKDLEEKYRADMVSYEAMYKRMEIEKQKVREMEKKLHKTSDKN